MLGSRRQALAGNAGRAQLQARASLCLRHQQVQAITLWRGLQTCALQQLLQAALYAGGGIQARAAQTFHQARLDRQGNACLAGEVREGTAEVTGRHLIGTVLPRALLGGLQRCRSQAAARDDQTQCGSVYCPRQWLNALRRRHVFAPAL
ncbi:hypothetical protein D3C79_817100 [compost metagenome]